MALYFANNKVNRDTDSFIFRNLSDIPTERVGLVLGTSRYTSSGRANPFFYNRIQAAKTLYFSGKVQYLLLSGDNRYFSYNEPREMRKELMRMGIPDSVIVMDFAGFRTLDSVVRGKKVFKLKRFIIISQEFHGRRAVFIARFHKIDAIAYVAKDPPSEYTWTVELREYFARVAMLLDLYLFDTKTLLFGRGETAGGSLLGDTIPIAIGRINELTRKRINTKCENRKRNLVLSEVETWLS
ncbi:MAG: YdcF family protein [Bacteroidetes bacterium]|nr:YdcF family protein [Bacteroidota bacterium]